ncbi:oxaA1 protein [Agrilactobacillus composti DSM 18527 = JCM 14202]|uniref:OxaA1 protein n=2 Tax=Agrilactobacillus TaxID=2767875 RepID=A0A0R1Y1E0_9LACO|nr:membrane protein insertase YidC [Agrilactobacillus composti]KRM35805.1 oxaA1 protein [Agrilactobacillus composti DSM 18527 = JCM 14202]
MKNKKTKYILLVLTAVVLLTVLSGCNVQNVYRTGQKPPTGMIYGTLYNVLALPMQHLINWTADLIGGPSGYGWGILIITFIVRLAILPLMLYQSNKSTTQQEKMQRVQPQLTLIQNAMRENKTPDAQTQLSQLQMKVYRENNLSLTGGIGCLPLIIQFPFMIAIYQAVMYSPEISSAHFLGISLGVSNIAVTIIATLLYVLQSWIMLQTVPEAQKKAMRMTALISPATTFVIAIIAPSGLGLYFLVGGIIFVIQQIIVSYVMTPRIRRNIDAELDKKPVVEVVTKDVINNLGRTAAAGATASNTNESLEKLHERNRRRNAGKQQRPTRK